MKSLLMKNTVLFVIIVLTGCTDTINAQLPVLSISYKDSVIQKVSQELEKRYVYPEVAKRITTQLELDKRNGYFNDMVMLNEFIDTLNAAIFRVSRDKHISITIRKDLSASDKDELEVDWKTRKLERRTLFRRNNGNFKSVQKLTDNIGYLDLRGFYGLDYGRYFADHAMAQLSSSDAIIIDLRNNSGGRGDMVNYLLSFFFEDQIITGKSRRRSGDSYAETVNKTPFRLKGKTIANTPIFILTSKLTFSAAEAFSYPMQVYGRATFIGETTKGGANAGDIISINEELDVFIPDVAGLPHPINNAIFEGEGIIPDIEVSSEQALQVAIEQAKIAAANYKAIMDEKAKLILDDLDEKVAAYDGHNEEAIIQGYLDCRDNDIIFEEWELNSLGYQFLSSDQLDRALVILKTNTILYPHSANAFDSYAEALIQKGNIEEAILNYEKAVSIAKERKDERLELFIENLRKSKN